MKTALLFLLCWMLASAASAQTSSSPQSGSSLPKPINLSPIKAMIGYPKEAQEAQIQGFVLTMVLIDSTGYPIDQILLYACHPILGDAVSARLGDLRFVPMIENGKPIRSWLSIPFDFRLQPNNPRHFSEPANTGFMFLSGKDRRQVLNPFGTTYTAVWQKVKNRKVNGKPLVGQAFLMMEFDANCELLHHSFYGSGNPLLEKALAKHIKTLEISPDSELRQTQKPFRLVVPFSYH